MYSIFKTVKYKISSSSEWLEGLMFKGEANSTIYSLEGEEISEYYSVKSYPIGVKDFSVAFENGQVVVKLSPPEEVSRRFVSPVENYGKIIYTSLNHSGLLVIKYQDCKYMDPFKVNFRNIRSYIEEVGINKLWFSVKLWCTYVRTIYYHNLRIVGKVLQFAEGDRLSFTTPTKKLNGVLELTSSDFSNSESSLEISDKLIYLRLEGINHPITIDKYQIRCDTLGISSQCCADLFLGTGLNIINLIGYATRPDILEYSREFVMCHLYQLCHIAGIPYEKCCEGMEKFDLLMCHDFF